VRDAYKPIAYEQLTGLGTAKGPTAATVGTGPLKGTVAVFVAETQLVRWRDDGTDPTANVGMTLEPGIAMEYRGELNKIKFIETAASAKVNCSYYA
jgi:hypothetical protein